MYIYTRQRLQSPEKEGKTAITTSLSKELNTANKIKIAILKINDAILLSYSIKFSEKPAPILSKTEISLKMKAASSSEMFIPVYLNAVVYRKIVICIATAIRTSNK
jgi:hypothetical protein